MFAPTTVAKSPQKASGSSFVTYASVVLNVTRPVKGPEKTDSKQNKKNIKSDVGNKSGNVSLKWSEKCNGHAPISEKCPIADNPIICSEEDDGGEFTPVISHKRKDRKARRQEKQKDRPQVAKSKNGTLDRPDSSNRSNKQFLKNNKEAKTKMKKLGKLNGKANASKDSTAAEKIEDKNAAPKKFVPAPLPKVNPWKIIKAENPQNSSSVPLDKRVLQPKKQSKAASSKPESASEAPTAIKVSKDKRRINEKANDLSNANEKAKDLSNANEKAKDLSNANEKAKDLSNANEKAKDLSNANEKANDLSNAKEKANDLSNANEKANDLSNANEKANDLLNAADWPLLEKKNKPVLNGKKIETNSGKPKMPETRSKDTSAAEEATKSERKPLIVTLIASADSTATKSAVTSKTPSVATFRMVPQHSTISNRLLKKKTPKHKWTPLHFEVSKMARSQPQRSRRGPISWDDQIESSCDMMSRSRRFRTSSFRGRTVGHGGYARYGYFRPVRTYPSDSEDHPIVLMGTHYYGRFPPTFVELDADSVMEGVKKQVEYYFSEENLTGDFFLRRKMDEEGFIPVTLIASFHRMMALGADIPSILNAIKESDKLELVDGFKVRTKTNPTAWPIEDNLRTSDSEDTLRALGLAMMSEPLSKIPPPQMPKNSQLLPSIEKVSASDPPLIEEDSTVERIVGRLSLEIERRKTEFALVTSEDSRSPKEDTENAHQVKITKTILNGKLV